MAQNLKGIKWMLPFTTATQPLFFLSRINQFLVLPEIILCIYKQILIFRYIDFLLQMDHIVHTNGIILYTLFCTLFFQQYILEIASFPEIDSSYFMAI